MIYVKVENPRPEAVIGRIEFQRKSWDGKQTFDILSDTAKLLLVQKWKDNEMGFVAKMITENGISIQSNECLTCAKTFDELIQNAVNEGRLPTIEA